MGKTLKKSLAVGGVFAVALFGMAIHKNIVKLPLQRNSDMQWISALSDEKVFAGYVDNVFIGKVIRQTASVTTEFGPGTQFEIAVADNLKGNFSGNIRATQYSGYKDGVLYTVEGDIPLTVGSSYLFSSRNYGGENWITPLETGRKLLSQDKNLSLGALRALATKDARVLELKGAIKNQILLDSYGNIKTVPVSATQNFLTTK